MEKFSEMKYVRPDGEAYIRTIQKETKNFKEAAEFEGAHHAFVDLNRQFIYRKNQITFPYLSIQLFFLDIRARSYKTI